MPAQRLEHLAPLFERKGRVQEGADADLTVFDAERIEARASWSEPTLATAGITYLFVAGTAVIERGALNGAVTPGQGLRAPRR
jgi:N-acyl-D-aspartate/D-glutamate deacylase